MLTRRCSGSKIFSDFGAIFAATDYFIASTYLISYQEHVD